MLPHLSSKVLKVDNNVRVEIDQTAFFQKGSN
jgi:hypothetical protein